MYFTPRTFAQGVVMQTGLIWEFKIKIFFKYCGGWINMVRILKLGLERLPKRMTTGFGEDSAAFNWHLHV